MALTTGSIETWGQLRQTLQLAPSGPEAGRRAGRCRGRLPSERSPARDPAGRQESCGQHRPVPRTALRATAHPPVRPLWMAPATMIQTHDGDVLWPRQRPRGPCCPAEVLSRGELGARGLLRKRKMRRSTCHSALRVLTWSHGPPLPGLYPRFGVSIHLSGKRIHSLHQVLSSKGPITGRNQAMHNSQPGLVRMGIEGQME